MTESGIEQTVPLKVIDILFGVAVMGTVGTLIGIIMGGGIMPLASGAGLVLGGVIGFMGGFDDEQRAPREVADAGLRAGRSREERVEGHSARTYPPSTSVAVPLT